MPRWDQISDTVYAQYYDAVCDAVYRERNRNEREGTVAMPTTTPEWVEVSYGDPLWRQFDCGDARVLVRQQLDAELGVGRRVIISGTSGASPELWWMQDNTFETRYDQRGQWSEISGGWRFNDGNDATVVVYGGNRAIDVYANGSDALTVYANGDVSGAHSPTCENYDPDEDLEEDEEEDYADPECHCSECLPSGPVEDCDCEYCDEHSIHYRLDDEALRAAVPRECTVDPIPEDRWTCTDTRDSIFDQYVNGNVTVYVRRATAFYESRRVVIRVSGRNREYTEYLTWRDDGTIRADEGSLWRSLGGIDGEGWAYGDPSECNVYMFSDYIRVFAYGYNGSSGLCVYSDGRVEGFDNPPPPPNPFPFLSENVTPAERRPLRHGGPYGKLLLARGWGVELEYDRPDSERGYDYRCSPANLRAALIEKGLIARDEEWRPPNRREYSEWVCSTDSTVTGGECKSPILRGADTINPVRSVMKTITELGGRASDRCGTHVHHDVNDLESEQLRHFINNLVAAYDTMLTYIPSSRQRSRWCALADTNELQEVWRAASNGTLKKGAGGFAGQRGAFNFNSVLIRGSVEFRAHPGTLDSKLLEPWVAAGMALVEFSRQGHQLGRKMSPQTLMETFVDERMIHVDLARRFLSRCTNLHGEDAVVDPPALLRVA